MVQPVKAGGFGQATGSGWMSHKLLLLPDELKAQGGASSGRLISVVTGVYVKDTFSQSALEMGQTVVTFSRHSSVSVFRGRCSFNTPK